MSWCTIESDPGVFTELISEIGVKGVQVEELYALEKDTFDRLKPIFGLIFLFKWRRESDPRPVLEDSTDVFFAKQMIDNACATQAIINCLLNRPDVDVGPDLAAFREFTIALPPEMRGLALDEVKRVRSAHNSFARPEPFVVEEKRAAASADDDAFHFITYVPVNGALYELDGLKAGPILLDSCTDDDWLDKVTPHIQARIQRYSQSEIRFNLMAIIKNRQEYCSEQLAQFTQQYDRVNQQLVNIRSQGNLQVDLPSTEAEVQGLIQSIESQIAAARAEISEEQLKFERWKVENIRRKHNYIPFIFNLLKVLAEKNQLMPLVEAATRKQSQAMSSKK